ncbi:MAG: hypothetical protein AAB438_03230 [Patescibacteria group bacterium]
MNPELELAGPGQYDLQKVVLYRHVTQRNGASLYGTLLYNHLINTNELSSCLNLQDGYAIRKKGIKVYDKLYGPQDLFLWGSVVEDKLGNLKVPYLYPVTNERVVVRWLCLANLWYKWFPAAQLR